MSRIYDQKVDINPDEVRAFFDARAKKEQDPLNAVMLQNAGSTLANDRDIYEKENLLPVLTGQKKILEIACGAGRLARHYASQGHVYMGVDFSEDLLIAARKAHEGEANISFHRAAMPELDAAILPHQPPYDFILVTALFLYLNDDALEKTLELIASLSAPGAKVYIRDTLAEIDERLTLKNFYSKEMSENYNAIYRPLGFFMQIFEKTLLNKGFSLIEKGHAFPAHLRNQTETTQHYFIFEKNLTADTPHA